jgi:hypothetical protein
VTVKREPDQKLDRLMGADCICGRPVAKGSGWCVRCAALYGDSAWANSFPKRAQANKATKPARTRVAPAEPQGLSRADRKKATKSGRSGQKVEEIAAALGCSVSALTPWIYDVEREPAGVARRPTSKAERPASRAGARAPVVRDAILTLLTERPGLTRNDIRDALEGRFHPSGIGYALTRARQHDQVAFAFGGFYLPGTQPQPEPSRGTP